MQKNRGLKIFLILFCLILFLPIFYITYDRSLTPPPPNWVSPPYIPGQSWEDYAKDFLKQQNKPNALVHYLNAFSGRRDTGDHQTNLDMQEIMKYGWIKKYPNVESLLQTNQNAIDEIIRGARMKQCELPLSPVGDGAPYHTSFLSTSLLNTFIVLLGKKIESEHQSSEALQLYMDGIQFAKDVIPKEDIFLARLISLNMLKTDLFALLQLIDRNKLSFMDCKKTITELSRIEKELSGFPEELNMHRQRFYALAYRAYQMPFESIKMQNFKGMPMKYDLQALEYSGYILFNKNQILNKDTKFFGEFVSSATTKSYYDFMHIDWNAKVPGGLLFKKFNPDNYTQHYANQMVVVSLLRMAQIQAGIHGYHLKNKKWPKSLDDLKEYLSPIPKDPFTDQSFHVSQDSTGVFVYSVGPDFKDDSAQLLYDPTNGTISTGDIRP